MGMKKMEFENDNKIHPDRDGILFEQVNKENSKLSLKKRILDDLIDNSCQMSLMLTRIQNIEKILNNIWNETEDKWKEEIKEIKWKYAGIVLDRLFFYISVIYFLFTFFPLVFSMPNFYKPQ